jgi:hypothetical protein
MKKLIIAFGVAAGIVALGVGYLAYVHIVEAHRVRARIDAKLAPVEAALDHGTAPDATQVHALAAALDTRRALAELLHERGRFELFPSEFATLEASAEGDLAHWLSYPAELDAIPDEMRFLALAEVDDPAGALQYVAFRFRTNAPHWAANNGWMLGLSGPYRGNAPTLVDDTSETFSELDPVSEAALIALIRQHHGHDTEGPAVTVRIVRTAPEGFAP